MTTHDSAPPTEKVRKAAGNRGQGRKKGVPNKNTTALKEMILGALAQAGGMDYLHAQARDNPSAFMTLIGKVLPTTLAGDPSAPQHHVIRWDE